MDFRYIGGDLQSLAHLVKLVPASESDINCHPNGAPPPTTTPETPQTLAD